MSLLPTTDTDEKALRHKLIVELIRENDISTQTDLVREVKKKGLKCTQTTISRDLAELKVIKAQGHYKVAEFADLSGLNRALWDHGISVDMAGEHMLVLKTRVGAAQTVAIELDGENWKEVAGTLAGDDTIFIAVKGSPERDTVYRKLRKLLGMGAHG